MEQTLFFLENKEYDHLRLKRHFGTPPPYTKYASNYNFNFIMCLSQTFKLKGKGLRYYFVLSGQFSFPNSFCKFSSFRHDWLQLTKIYKNITDWQNWRSCFYPLWLSVQVKVSRALHVFMIIIKTNKTKKKKKEKTKPKTHLKVPLVVDSLSSGGPCFEVLVIFFFWLQGHRSYFELDRSSPKAIHSQHNTRSTSQRPL